jgi:hypothetical protein
LATWGGKRPGAGRKKKGAVSPAAMGGLDLRAALSTPAPAEVEPVAALHAQSSVDALLKVIVNGASDAARVSAAKEILDRGWGKPTAESGGDLMLPFFGTAPAREVPSAVREACRKLTELAIQTLVKVRDASSSETARVQAAKALLDRGIGAVAPARVPEDTGLREIGKKAEAERAARNPDTQSPIGRLMAERAAAFGAGKPN